jgi:ABC-type branched-subunit amino acid transport system substrate-binding protein
MFRRAFVLLAGTLALAACTTVPETGAGGYPPSILNPGPSAAPGAIPLTSAPVPAPAGRAVAILAPLTGVNAERGLALVRAAQLALEPAGSPPLDVRDTAGTPQGAAAAAQAAIAAGDGLILGPLTTAETAAAAGPARAAGVPVLAFTSDPAQAQPGVWPLGLTPAQQVRRMVGAVLTHGKNRFAALLPRSDFGNALGGALTQVATAAGAPPPDVRFYESGNQPIADAVRDISGYTERRGPLEAELKAARARHDAEGRRLAADLARQTVKAAPFDALLLADTGDHLAWLSSFLPYYDLAPDSVRVLGPALWAEPSTRAGAELTGAWYAAPDPAGRAAFTAAYTAKYGSPAPGLADFAYDAASIARVLAEGGGYAPAALCRPEGFTGTDGLLALQADGTVRRGLALFEIQRGGAAMIEPAPDNMSAPGV